MPSTVEIVRAICKEKDIPISRLEQDLGYGNGYFNPKKAKNTAAPPAKTPLKPYGANGIQFSGFT